MNFDYPNQPPPPFTAVEIGSPDEYAKLHKLPQIMPPSKRRHGKRRHKNGAIKGRKWTAILEKKRDDDRKFLRSYRSELKGFWPTSLALHFMRQDRIYARQVVLP